MLALPGCPVWHHLHVQPHLSHLPTLATCESCSCVASGHHMMPACCLACMAQPHSKKRGAMPRWWLCRFDWGQHGATCSCRSCRGTAWPPACSPCHLVRRTCRPNLTYSHALPAGVSPETSLCRQVVDKRRNRLGVDVQTKPLFGREEPATMLWLSAVQEGGQGAAEHAGSQHSDQGLDQGGEAGGAEGALWQGVGLHQGAGHRGAQSVPLHWGCMCHSQLWDACHVPAWGFHVPLAAMF